MKKVLYLKAFIIPVILLMIMMLIARLNVPEVFSSVEHSLTFLGSQGMEQAYFMNVGFIGFGLLVVLMTAAYHHQKELPEAISFSMVSFGIAIILIGVWRDQNILDVWVNDMSEVNSHQIFYKLAMFSFLICVLMHAIISKSKKLKKIHFIFVIVLGISLIPWLMPLSFHGIFDRLLWLTILIWIPLFYGRIEDFGNNRGF